jgi:hypothetical protein
MNAKMTNIRRNEALKKTVPITIMLIIVLSISIWTMPIPDDITQSINKTSQHLKGSRDKWNKAADEIKNVEDYFRFMRFNYEKNEIKEFRTLLSNTEKSIAQYNETKSKKDLKNLTNHWNKMNKSAPS